MAKGNERKSSDEVVGAFASLKEHLFTTIGLSDREKLHTGMLSFVINNLQEDAQLNLLKSLWGNDAIVWPKGCKFVSEVERNSVDLIVKLKTADPESNEIVLWAEVKFKTTLSKDQIKKYKVKLPESAKGALFALFTEVDFIPTGFREVAFQNVIVDLKDEILANLRCSGDSLAMVRLWIDYLESISVLTKYMVERKLATIDAPRFRNGLEECRMKGIFEHYRNSLFLEEFEKRLARLSDLNSPENRQRWSIHHFNSKGSSGIDFRIKPFPDLEPDKWDSHMVYGLQWQSGALKLFIDVAPDSFYSSAAMRGFKNPLTSAGYRQLRVANLGNLFEKMNFVGPVEPLKKKDPQKFKFYSRTIHKWDNFGSIDDKVDILVKYIQQLIDPISEAIVKTGTELNDQVAA